MKLTAICAVLALTTGAAMAQTTDPKNMDQSPTATPTPTTPTTSDMQQTPPTADAARKDMNANKQDPLAMQGSDAKDWATVEGHDKGFIAKDEALPNSWLALNFVNCDKNQDGKVDKAEYEDCAKKRR
jgi:Flp pilus assembly protein TadD